MAAKFRLVAVQRLAKVAEVDSLVGVIGAELFLRPVKIDRRVMAGLADQPDDPLRLAERIGADDMRSLGLCRDRRQQPFDFPFRVRMLEHRKAEGRLGDEQVAGDKLEGLRGAVGMRLVVAGDDRHLPAIGKPDLRASQDMSGRVK